MSEPMTVWSVVRTGALVAGAGVAVPLLWRAGLSAYDQVYERVRRWQHDRETLNHIRTQNALRDIRTIPADERGRYPLLYGVNGILRDPNNLRSFTIRCVRETWPGLEHLDAVVRAVVGAGGWPAAATAERLLPESGPAAVQWPAVVDLVGLFRDRQPTIYDLVVGVRPTEAGGLAVIGDSLHNLMHVLEVGASGWGKSTWLRSFLWQIAKAREPVEVVAVDVNGSEFNVLHEWGKLRYPVARTTNDAIAVLDQVSQEIARRKAMYEQHPLVTKLVEYNEATGQDLPPWVVAIDEGTNLLNQHGIGEPLRAAVQMARQYGVYVLLAGQSAKHSVIDTQIRDQFSTRLCFRTSPTSSRVVLDDRAAGDLTTKGRAVVQMVGREMLEIQGPFVSREAFLQALSNGGPRYKMPAQRDGDHDRGDGTGPTADQVARVIEMYQAGESKRAIQKEVFGYIGGAAHDRVNEILENVTITDGGQD